MQARLCNMRAARFIALMHDGISMELDVIRRWRRCACGRWGPRAAIEFLFASLLAYGSRSIGHPT